jgi:hypothetical protein
MQCDYLIDLITEISNSLGKNPNVVRSVSKCLSADVTACYDPNFSDVYEKRNSALISCGAAMSKSQEIKSWVLDEIKKGTFDKDAPLPGDLELMNRFGVSRGTVRLALFELQRQGLIKRRRGKGTFLSRQGMRKSGVIGVLFPELDTCEYFRDIEPDRITCLVRCPFSFSACK